MKKPLIISASRRSDIPAFYSKWFSERLLENYVSVTNPYYKNKLEYSLENLKFVVFWTKNPKPMFDYLHLLDTRKIGYYFQYSLNNYDLENYEPSVMNLDKRIETFKSLSNKIGSDKIVWRYDPLIVSEYKTIDNLIADIKYISNKLTNSTNRLVFSYLNIYSHLKQQAKDLKIIQWTIEMQNEFAEKLANLNLPYEIMTCSEKIDLSKYGITKSKCIDPELILKIKPDIKLANEMGYIKNKFLNKFEKIKSTTDKGQRLLCECTKSTDIGEYNTCLHFCKYCYANKIDNDSIINNYNKINNK